VLASSDRRYWLDTDRPGERIAVGSPLRGVYLMSALDSDRRCREYHTDFRICLLRGGRSSIGVSYRCRGQHSAGSGELMAFEPGDHHVTTAVTGKVAFDVVGVSIERLEAAAQELGLRGKFHFKTPHIAHPNVASCMRTFIASAAAAADAFTLECQCTLFLEQLVRTCGESPPPVQRRDAVRHFGIRKARDYLRDHYLENVGLDDLAKIAGLSRFAFAHAFKQHVGVAPHAYLKLRRACEARHLVEQGLPIVDVMARLGYTDVPFLTRTLKTHFGVTPARWRFAFKANTKSGRLADADPLPSRQIR
jgi:AraC-like DNA-binding protein